MSFALELDVQVVAAASSAYTPQQIQRRLEALRGRKDDPETLREREFLLQLLNPPAQPPTHPPRSLA
jgi:hypothetical protein